MAMAMNELAVTYTFPSSHHALWAEDVAREMDIAVEMGSAPAESRSKCGLALRVGGAQVEELETAFRTEGIDFQRWSV
ncbi:MAG: DUF3343 domain-containing protein [Gemmatimonadales bacterium]|nr:MAG: DUF3343 domain-containing protein [Gemmatimonadales bacterium]